MSDTADSPFFSIVIPTYNRADTIRPILESVQNQTFGDFECLVIDDGSKDGHALASVISSLGDSRFEYVRKDNGGASKARNVGIDAARGRFIALLDSDDSFFPEKLEKCARALENCHDDVLVYSQLIVERGIEKVWVRPPRGLRPGERVDEYLMCDQGRIQTSSMVLPVSLARQVRFDESLPSSQDTDFAIRVANAGARFIFLAEPLVVFEDSTHHTRVSKGKNYEAQLAWIERMRHANAVSDRAYWAYRGWQCARLASYSNRLMGIRLYVTSAIRGVFQPRQAIVIAAQILLPRDKYQEIANRVVSVLGRRRASGHENVASDAGR